MKNILESLLFVADEPLSVKRLKKIIPQTDTREIRQAMSDLAADYDKRHTSFYLSEVAGGYQLRTRPAYTEWIRRLVQPKPARLSKAALETLAIVAYKQPVMRSEIEHIRGVDSGGVLRMLMERKLIRILGRKEIPGRPLIYATTKLFLEVFGLKDLKELPTPEEIEALGSDEILPDDPGKPVSGNTGDPQSNPEQTSHLPEQETVPAKLDQERTDAAADTRDLADTDKKDLDANKASDYKNGKQSGSGG